jgi:hypothetical protein
MPKLTMNTKPEKASINNSGEKAVGVELYLDQITKAEPFASLFSIKAEVFEAIKADMKVNGFDPSKPVNVWRKSDGTRVLIDGNTRVRAAEELGSGSRPTRRPSPPRMRPLPTRSTRNAIAGTFQMPNS